MPFRLDCKNHDVRMSRSEHGEAVHKVISAICDILTEEQPTRRGRWALPFGGLGISVVAKIVQWCIGCIGADHRWNYPTVHDRHDCGKLFSAKFRRFCVKPRCNLIVG